MRKKFEEYNIGDIVIIDGPGFDIPEGSARKLGKIIEKDVQNRLLHLDGCGKFPSESIVFLKRSRN